MLRDHINYGVRASAALALRHIPAVRGRWHVARIVNKCFPPLSQSCSTSWVRMRLGHEMLVDLRSGTEFHSYYLGDFDTDAIRSALRLLKRNSIALDVGANIGFWSVPLARHLRGSGRLHAFEPVSANFERLAENIRRNNLDATAYLHQLGLSDQNGSLRISLWDELAAETGNAAIIMDAEAARCSRCSEITVCRLDDVFGSLGINRVDFIKADIEGHEGRFLAGAAATINRFRPILYLEINRPCYRRQGLDVSTIFEDWLYHNSYRTAIHTRAGWCLDTLRKCKTLDDAFFFPSEVAAACIERIRS
jgi:FkbM family methyltransferase